MSKAKKIIPLNAQTYLAVINNSVGSKSFRNVYASINGRKTDITRNGELSCSFFASSVLTLFKFIKEIHVTVDSTVRDLERSGWKEIAEPRIGCVLVWEKGTTEARGGHKHIGFYIGNGKAVSNSTSRGYPIVHDWNKKRKTERILWHDNVGR